MASFTNILSAAILAALVLHYADGKPAELLQQTYPDQYGGQNAPENNGYDKPVQPEPVQEEPLKHEPVQHEPVKKEPARNEPLKNEPARNEPVQNEPVRNEPVQNEPVQSQPVIREPEYNGYSEPENERYDTVGYELYDIPAQREPAHNEQENSEYNKSQNRGYNRAGYEGQARSVHGRYERPENKRSYGPRYPWNIPSKYETKKQYGKDVRDQDSLIRKEEEPKLYQEQ